MEMLDFLVTAAPEQVNVALHAGELTLGLVHPRELRFHIREAVEVGQARRIGHGVDIAYENDALGLLKEMRERGILVEICLTSNDVILNVRGDEHPLPLYLDAGVPLTLATDDEGVSRIDLTNEYLRAALTYDLGYRDLKTMARNSLAHSFLPGAGLWQSGTFAVTEACAGDDPRLREPNPRLRRFPRIQRARTGAVAPRSRTRRLRVTELGPLACQARAFRVVRQGNRAARKHGAKEATREDRTAMQRAFRQPSKS